MGTGIQTDCRVSGQLNFENQGLEQSALIGPVSSGVLDKMTSVSSNQNYCVILTKMLLLSLSSCCS